MASMITMKNPFAFLIFVAISSLLVNFSSCINLKLLNTTSANGFSAGFATWYGPPTGAGTESGACGFGDKVSKAPYYSFVAAGNSKDLFMGGKGCGACYQVVCTTHPACSRSPITITITDECTGACNNQANHFDLSGTAFGALAKSGQANTLRNVGQLNIGFQRVPCNYRG